MLPRSIWLAMEDMVVRVVEVGGIDDMTSRSVKLKKRCSAWMESTVVVPPGEGRVRGGLSLYHDYRIHCCTIHTK